MPYIYNAWYHRRQRGRQGSLRFQPRCHWHLTVWQEPSRISERVKLRTITCARAKAGSHVQLRSLEFHQLSSDDCQEHCQSSFDRCHWSFQAPYSAVSDFLTASAFSGGFASASTLRHSMCSVLVYFHHEMISGRPFCKVSTLISATKIGTNSIL